MKMHDLPLLKPDLLGARAGLRGDELLQIPDGIIRVAFDSNLLSKTIVTNHFDHVLNKRDTETAAINSLVQFVRQGCKNEAAAPTTLDRVLLDVSGMRLDRLDGEQQDVLEPKWTLKRHRTQGARHSAQESKF